MNPLPEIHEILALLERVTGKAPRVLPPRVEAPVARRHVTPPAPVRPAVQDPLVAPVRRYFARAHWDGNVPATIEPAPLAERIEEAEIARSAAVLIPDDRPALMPIRAFFARAAWDGNTREPAPMAAVPTPRSQPPSQPAATPAVQEATAESLFATFAFD